MGELQLFMTLPQFRSHLHVFIGLLSRTTQTIKTRRKRTNKHFTKEIIVKSQRCMSYAMHVFQKDTNEKHFSAIDLSNAKKAPK